MKNNNFLKIATFSFLTLVTSCREELPNTENANNSSIHESSVKNGSCIFQTRNHCSLLTIKLKMQMMRQSQNTLIARILFLYDQWSQKKMKNSSMTNC